MSTVLPRRRDDLEVEVESKEARLTDPVSGETHVLNPSAYAIWELCDGATAPAAMAEAVAEVTLIDVAEAERQIERTIEILRERGLVT